MESRKMVLMNLFSGQQRRNRHREQICGHGGEGRRERMKCMESNVETYNSTCKIDSQWDLLYDSGNSNRGSVTISKGGTQREMGGSFGREGTWMYL